MADTLTDMGWLVNNGLEPDQSPGPQVRVDLDKEKRIIERSNLMFQQMELDRPHYNHLDEYARGNQEDPYVPNYADPMARELARRSTMNLMTLAVNVPAQMSYIDGYSRKDELDPKEWEVWHRSQMPAKQTRILTASLKYGSAYTMLSNIGTEDRRIDMLSSRDTICFFEDAVNDTAPIYALTIKSRPSKLLPGRAIYLDAEQVIHLDFDGKSFKIAKNGIQPHNLGITPLVRWPCILDDRGVSKGVIEGLIDPQDRLNQAVYDLLLNGSFGSYKVRTAAGLVGEPLFNDDGTPRTDADGNQVYGPIRVSQSHFLTAEDPKASFGTLDHTPQDGFIGTVDQAVKNFAVIGQLPPHSLLGSMSNLSADTLKALMSQTTRFTQMLKGGWADAALTMMKIVSRDMGIEDGVDPVHCEIRWRDMEEATMSSIVDALGKASQMLDVPGRGLWSRIPGATDSEIAKWDELREQQQADAALNNPLDLTAATARESTPKPPPDAVTTERTSPTPRDALRQMMASMAAAPSEVTDA